MRRGHKLSDKLYPSPAPFHLKEMSDNFDKIRDSLINGQVNQLVNVKRSLKKAFDPNSHRYDLNLSEDRTLDLIKKEALISYLSGHFLKEVTLLHEVVLLDNKSAADLLIDLGAKVDAFCGQKDGITLTPIQLAILLSNDSMVNHLLKKGADVYPFNSQGYNSLALAVISSNKRAVEMLVEKKKELLRTVQSTKAAESCLHLAVKRHNLDMVQLLIKLGAEVNTIDANKQTPLHYICREPGLNWKPLFGYLLSKGASLYEKDSKSETPLTLILKKMKLQAIKEIIAHFPRFIPKEEFTASLILLYHEFTRIGTLDLVIVCYFEVLGIGVNAQNDKQETLLHSLLNSCQPTDFERFNTNLQILLLNNASLSSQDLSGNTPLMISILKNLSIAIISQLLSPETLRLENSDGCNALDLAMSCYKEAELNHKEIVINLLLRNGAQIVFENGSFLSKIKKANAAIYSATLELIVTKYYSLTINDFDAALNWRLDVIALALTHGVNLGNAVRLNYPYALLVIVNTFLVSNPDGCLHLLRYLVDKFQFDVNYIDSYSLLHLLSEKAKLCDVYPLLDYLLSLPHINLTIYNGGKSNALSYALKMDAYEVAAKIIFASNVSQNAHNSTYIRWGQITFRPGFSVPLLRLLEAGIVFTDPFLLMQRPNLSAEVINEWNWFKYVCFMKREGIINFTHLNPPDLGYTQMTVSFK